MNAYFFHTHNLNIFDQLKLEEAFLRTSEANLILINVGSPKNVVLGISSSVEKLINIHTAKEQGVPLIRRYSGGGTVVVNQDTIFVSFIFNHQDLKLEPYPQKIMEWTSQFYSELLKNEKFNLRENDYVIESKKFGGNAQYLTKKRFVHHSSLLFDLDLTLMKVLKIPTKAPIYRENRDHMDFLTSLKPLFSTKESFVNSLKEILKKHFKLIPTNLESMQSYLKEPHRQSTQYLDLSSFSHFDHLSQIDQKMLV